MRWTIQGPWALRNSMVLSSLGFLFVSRILDRMLRSPQPRNVNALRQNNGPLPCSPLAKDEERDRQEKDRKGTTLAKLHGKCHAFHPHPHQQMLSGKPRFSPLPGGIEALLPLFSGMVQKKQSGDSEVPSA